MSRRPPSDAEVLAFTQSRAYYHFSNALSYECRFLPASWAAEFWPLEEFASRRDRYQHVTQHLRLAAERAIVPAPTGTSPPLRPAPQPPSRNYWSPIHSYKVIALLPDTFAFGTNPLFISRHQNREPTNPNEEELEALAQRMLARVPATAPLRPTRIFSYQPLNADTFANRTLDVYARAATDDRQLNRDELHSILADYEFLASPNAQLFVTRIYWETGFYDREYWEPTTKTDTSYPRINNASGFGSAFPQTSFSGSIDNVHAKIFVGFAGCLARRQLALFYAHQHHHNAEIHLW